MTVSMMRVVGFLLVAVTFWSLLPTAPARAALLWDFVIEDLGGGLSGQGQFGFSAASSDDPGAEVEKALLEATLFGLPMSSVMMPSGQGASATWEISPDWILISMEIDTGGTNLAVAPTDGLMLNFLTLSFATGEARASCSDPVGNRCNGTSTSIGVGFVAFTAVHVDEPPSLLLLLFGLSGFAVVTLHGRARNGRPGRT